MEIIPKKIKKTKIDNYIYSNLKKINYMKKNIKVKCSVLKTEVDQIISNFNKNQRNKKNKGNIFTNKENKNYNTLAIWIRVIPYFWGLGGEGQIGQGFEIEVKLFRSLIIL